MMNIVFYNFGKKNNSTKFPDVQGTTLDCQLKGQCSIFNPTFIINTTGHTPPIAACPTWNYCKVVDFGPRYYFIDNWTWLNGVWECSCVVDVLASYKYDIRDMYGYVLRSASENDPTITDTAYITTTEVETENTFLPAFFVSSLSSGFYIVGIIGEESTATQGAITYYQMTPAEMANFRAYLLSDTFLTDHGLVQLADFIPADATKVIYNPYQYIVSCMWFPFPPSAIPAGDKTQVWRIPFGWWLSGTGMSAYRLKDSVQIYWKTEDIAINDHPQISRGSYMNRSPYTSRTLRLPPFSEVILPDMYFDSGFSLRIELECDFITGDACVNLYAMDNNGIRKAVLTRLTQKLGVDIQLAQVGTDYFGAFTQSYNDTQYMFDKTVGAVSGVDLSGVIKAAISGVKAGAAYGQVQSYETVALGNYLKAKAPQLLTSGSNGSLLMMKQYGYLCETFYIVAEDDPQQLGQPLCKIKRLGDLSGYMVVMNPEVEFECFEAERSLITQFLSTGFFYEE